MLHYLGTNLRTIGKASQEKSETDRSNSTPLRATSKCAVPNQVPIDLSYENDYKDHHENDAFDEYQLGRGETQLIVPIKRCCSTVVLLHIICNFQPSLLSQRETERERNCQFSIFYRQRGRCCCSSSFSSSSSCRYWISGIAE